MLSMLLLGCTQANVVSFELGKEFSVKENTNYFNEENDVFVNVVSFNDSRCPADVQCIWEGELGVTLTVGFSVDGSSPSGKFTEVILGETTRPKADIGNYTIELKSIEVDSAVIVVKQNNPNEKIFALGETLSVHEGEIYSDNSGIKFLVGSFFNSRCEEGMACVWEGELGIRIIPEDGTSLNNPEFSIQLSEKTNPKQNFSLYTFELVSIDLEKKEAKIIISKSEQNTGRTEWFSIEPVQCGGNAWESWGTLKLFATENDRITAWLEEEKGIIVSEVKSRQVSEVVCLACSCPRGDQIAVLANSSDAEKLIELGFAKMEPIACTEDAKVCPDGSAVGREAPFCEFQKCPGETVENEYEEPIIVKTDVPGFTIPEFANETVTGIYADGRVTIETTNWATGVVSFREEQLTQSEVDALIDFIETTNFFEEGEIMQCVADAPSKNIKISLNGKENELIGIGLECPDEISEEIREIISKIETLIPASTINPGFLQVSEAVENPENYLDEENIQVQGIVSDPVACTLKFCSEEDPCCNSCGGIMHDIENPELTLQISGNECNLNFENENVVIFGSLVSTEAGYVLNAN